MKIRLIVTFFSLFLLFVVGCQDEQKRFCIQAASSLCAQCEQCGDFTACGLTRVTNRHDCVTTLEHVCSAYDSLYSKEVGRACLHGIEQLKCETLKASGKPEVCTRLF